MGLTATPRAEVASPPPEWSQVGTCDARWAALAVSKAVRGCEKDRGGLHVPARHAPARRAIDSGWSRSEHALQPGWRAALLPTQAQSRRRLPPARHHRRQGEFACGERRVRVLLPLWRRGWRRVLLRQQLFRRRRAAVGPEVREPQRPRQYADLHDREHRHFGVVGEHLFLTAAP